ncbi:MAG: LicD family protein [Firmicutes bacterium]|nr:LicD family protein [Bacillota bacterium]
MEAKKIQKPLHRKLIDSTLHRKQELQFLVNNVLSKVHISSVEDPLFNCKLTAGKAVQPKFSAAFVIVPRSMGITIKGHMELDESAGRPDSIEVKLDGKTIRKEQLVFKNNRASFAFPIKRPTLAHFPKSSELQVVTSLGDIIPWKNSDRVCLEYPSGTGQIHQLIEERGLLDKKGFIRLSAEELKERQNEYLKLYEKVRAVFDKDVGRPLFIIYGTLLGMYRDGDFIPGDDDFDVGYISKAQDPLSVKKEVEEIIFTLMRSGFTIVFNRRGKPFRIRETGGDPEIHLDVRPVWYQDGHVWAHKQACMPLKLEGFENIVEAQLRETKVYIPQDTEGFLRAYYGEGWKTPDPSFSNSSTAVPDHVRQNLKANCFSPSELLKLKRLVERERAQNPNMGELIAIGLMDLYPLSDYEIS